ncbi:MAG: hypothetical protein CL902_03715 [Dehalococcoidia bacterium]|nr:hypothetical protein [Dehalococcoidia bacterium]
MPLDIDIQRTAVLSMDFSNDIVHSEGALKEFGFADMVSEYDVLDKTGQLLVAARGTGVRVVHVSVKFQPGYPERPANSGLWQSLQDADALRDGTWGAQIHPRVAAQASEAVVTKRGVPAFTGTDLDQILRANGIDTVMLAGVATNLVVEGTARQACDMGYNTIVVGNCCAAEDKWTHDAALTITLPSLCTVTSLDEALAAMGARVLI